MALSGIVISRITRAGDVGEPGYSVDGEDLPACRNRNAHDPWHGATQGNNVAYAMPSRCYITESVYNYLTPEERENVRSYVRGIVPDSYWKNGTCPFYPYTPSPVFSVSTSRPMPLSDPCEGVTCPDICINADNYSQVCAEEGVDIGTCVFDQLLESNSPDCPGYMPPSIPPDMDIIDVRANETAEEGTEQKIHLEFQDYGTKTIWFSTSIFINGIEYIGRSDAGALGLNGGGTYTVFAGSFVMPDHGITGEAVLKGRYEDSEAMFECDRKEFTIECDYVPPEEPEPEPDDDDKWIIYALIGAAVVLFYLLGWSS